MVGIVFEGDVLGGKSEGIYCFFEPIGWLYITYIAVVHQNRKRKQVINFSHE
jgi:hypothetical protein